MTTRSKKRNWATEFKQVMKKHFVAWSRVIFDSSSAMPNAIGAWESPIPI